MGSHCTSNLEGARETVHEDSGIRGECNCIVRCAKTYKVELLSAIRNFAIEKSIFVFSEREISLGLQLE